MADFHFLRPLWLLALLVLLLATPWLWRSFKHGGGWRRVIAPHLLPELVKQPTGRSAVFPFAMLCSAWVITSIALAGPTWQRTPLPLHQSERGVVLVIDMSMSTRAADVSPDRMTRLKFKAVDLLESLEGAQAGLVAYAGDAFTITPLTPDKNNILNLLPGLVPEIMPVPGNDPLLAMEQADQLLRDSGHAEGEIYWFSAGMSRRDLQDLLPFARATPHRISALIAGDDDGAPVRLESGEMLRDPQGRIMMAQLNAAFFDRITGASGGRVSRLTADSADINQLLDQGPLAERLADEDTLSTSVQWRDMGPYLALLLLPIVAWVSRRGIIWCLLPLLFIGYHPPVVAQELSSNPLQTREQRAQQLFDAGNYSEAAELFQHPMRQGNAHYRAGNYESAIRAFSQLDSAEAWYNLGNSYAQSGDFEAASHAYEQTLERRPDWSQAAENKELVDSLREQQPPENGHDDADEPEQEEESPEEQDAGQDSNQQDPSDEEAADDESQAQQDEGAGGEEQQAQAEQTEDGQPEETLQPQYTDDELTEEERQEMEQLLRSLPEDPTTLLRNRMRIEAERRQSGQLPRGVRQQW